MAHLIDTYNLQHAGSAMGGSFTDLTVRKLCQFILAAPKRISATLILDGRPKPDEPGENEFPEINFVYSGTGVKADTVIAQLVERSGHRKKIEVVTNDRAVALHARRHGASAVSCESFLAQLIGATRNSSIEKRTGTIPPGETEHWLKEFGITPPPPKPSAKSDIDEIDMDRLMGGG